VPYQCTYEAVSNTGLKRQVNEDNYTVTQLYKGAHDEKQKLATLVIIADGMGGSIGGQIASKKAVEKISASFDTLQIIPEEEKIQGLIEDWIMAAHNVLVNMAIEDSSLAGMGTTLTLLLILEDKAYISWVGDSRVYVYRHKSKKVDKITAQSKLKLLTRDHSFVWEQINKGLVTLDVAETLDYSHIITHSLGSIKNQPFVEHTLFKLKSNDKFMVCTDGVNLHLKTEELSNELSKIKEFGLAHVAKEFEQKILARGADDNFTFVLLDYVFPDKNNSNSKSTPLKDFIRSSRKELLLGTLLSVLLIWIFSKIDVSTQLEFLQNDTISENLDISNPGKMVIAHSNLLDSLNNEANNQLTTLLTYNSDSISYLNLKVDYVSYLDAVDSIITDKNRLEPDEQSKILLEYRMELKELEARFYDELQKLKANEDI
jgi:protein phosphatase